MITKLDFESVQEIVNFCNSDKKAYSSARKAIDDFNTLNNWQETLDTINTGWGKGLKNISIIVEDILAQIGSSVFREDLVPSVAGMFFDVGLVCSGQPECWFNQQTTDEIINSGQKIVNIGINTSVSAGLSVNACIERGASILALSELLERMNKSVSITQYCSTSNNMHTFQGSLVLKTAGELIDINLLSFWLVCPDAFRRCWFRVLEVLPTAEPLGALGRGYGFPIADYGKDKSDIFIKGIRSVREWSRTDSLNWIVQELAAQGIQSRY